MGLDRADETAALIHEHTRSGPARQTGTADALDAKAFQVFSAATILLGLGAFTVTHSPPAAAWALYGLAVVAYAGAAIATWRVIQVMGLYVVDAADRWWPAYRRELPMIVRARLLDDLAAAAAHNRAALAAKAAPVQCLLVAVAAEAIFIAAAVIAALR